MPQVNGLPEEHRDIKPLQDTQNPATTDASEVVIFGDDVKDNSLADLPYMPINGVKDLDNNSIMLDEVVVTAKAPEKKSIALPTVKVDIPEKIDLKVDMRKSAADLVATYGGKFQKREVNGQKQEIVILKFGKEQHKFAVNEDGSLGEELVTVSTLGKSKYITKSEHERRMEVIFRGPAPEGVDVSYYYENGAINPVFTKDGKRLSNKELRALIPVENVEQEDTTVEENVDENQSNETYSQYLYNHELVSKSLKDASGNNLITPEILELFKNGDADINYKDILDEAGKIKPEFKLFDLNDDGKLDNREKEFFSSGGKIASKQKVSLSIDKGEI